MIKQAAAQKEVSTKLTKGLLDMIILQFLNNESMHGYQIISKIRKNFGIYFGPSTIYPLLGGLEKKGYVDSHWNMNFDRPRKVYSLNKKGQSVLNFTEESLNLICRKIVSAPQEHQPMVGILAAATRDNSPVEIR
jgi:DNA-binding PadR family transcriptional regulator